MDWLLQVRSIIDNYKASNRTIGSKCRQISEMLLVKVDGKRVYDGNEFEVEQAKHRKKTVRKLKEIYNGIIGTMSKTFEVGCCRSLYIIMIIPIVDGISILVYHFLFAALCTFSAVFTLEIPEYLPPL